MTDDGLKHLQGLKQLKYLANLHTTGDHLPVPFPGSQRRSLLPRSRVSPHCVAGDQWPQALIGRDQYLMHQSRNFDFRRGRHLGTKDHVVRWRKPARPKWMDKATYQQMPDELVIRELHIKVQEAGFRVSELVLVTTMQDPKRYRKEELADLFLARWNIELDLRSIKDIMQMAVLSCKTPEMVQKEIWMHALAYNLIRGVIARAAEANDEEPRHISFKGALQTMTAFQDYLKQATPHERERLIAEMLRAIATHRVGDRPNRAEPRANRRRPKPQRHLNEPRDQARKHLLANG